MARKADDRPVAVKQSQQPQQPTEAPQPRRRIVHDPGLAMIAANLEREIDEDIAKLEQLWYPINASTAENDDRLEATTRILIEMGVRTRQFATYITNSKGYCKQYLVVDGNSMLTLRFLIVEEDEASPINDPGGDKEPGQVRGDGGIGWGNIGMVD